jgi:hypothetical protein
LKPFGLNVSSSAAPQRPRLRVDDGLPEPGFACYRGAAPTQLWLIKESIPMRKFIVLALFLGLPSGILVQHAQAQSCPAGYGDMLDWMTLDTAATQHLTGPQNLPLYSKLPSGGLFWWIKGKSGYPWDIQYYDANNIYQWITDYDPHSYTDPHYFKSFDSKTGMPWTPICVPQGSAGQKLSSITVPSAQTGYHEYGPNCNQVKTQFYLGNTVNEVWNYGNLNIDNTNPPGNLGTNPDLQLSYRYSCDSSYSNCKYQEVYDFMQKYGEVRWTYSILQNGSYVQQSQTVFNKVVSGGTPTPDFPCPM